jgi:Nidogen-like/PEP-CTERM motif
MTKQLVLSAIAASLVAIVPMSSANAAAIHDAGLFTNVLPANDDGSTGLVNLGFSALINSSTYGQTYVNNNGNITFDSALYTYTPSAISNGSYGPIIAPFFADVDTRASGSLPVTFGSAVLGGRNVFGVNYINVGVYYEQPIYDSFQMILTDRSDTGAGNFDIEFNYDQILWEAGTASGAPSGGLGGTSALVGYWTSDTSNYTLPGSLVNGAFVNGGPDALVSHSLNSSIAGQYIFQVRGGVVQPPSSVPEPASLSLLGIGLAGMAGLRRRKKA